MRKGSSFPGFLKPRRMAEKALTAVVQEAHVLAGCGKWVRPGAFPEADSEKIHFYEHISRDFAGFEGFLPFRRGWMPPVSALWADSGRGHGATGIRRDSRTRL